MKWGNYDFFDTMKYFNNAGLANIVNSLAGREENDDGTWDCTNEDFSAFKVKKLAWEVLYKSIDPDLTNKKR